MSLNNVLAYSSLSVSLLTLPPSFIAFNFIMWYPYVDSTNSGYTSPTFILATVSAYAETVYPSIYITYFPPSDAVVSSEFSFARVAKSSPANALSRIPWAFVFNSAFSSSVIVVPSDFVNLNSIWDVSYSFIFISSPSEYLDLIYSSTVAESASVANFLIYACII